MSVERRAQPGAEVRDENEWVRGATREYDPASEEFAELRELLLGTERRRLEELENRVAGQELTAEVLAERLPDAIALRAGRDQKLARALAPTIDDALSESVRRNPRDIATAIFPVLGPAIRKALAEAMAGLVASINRAVEHTFSLRGLRWRMESWRTGTPYAQVVIKHALVYRVEQVFLIHAETGLLLQHVAPPQLTVADADLVSGMLTAIQDFVADSFRQQEGGGGRLREFSVGELTVLVEPGPRALLAAVVRGQPPESLRLKLQDRLETLHFQFANDFLSFSGDAAPFAASRAILEECLEVVLDTDRGRSRSPRWAWARWATPLLVLIGVLIFLNVRSARRFNAALTRLRAEPGLQVVSAERRGGTWRIQGLKDPLAREPAVILAGLGVDISRLETQWKPYLSLEPALVISRARQLLSVPGTVTLSLSQDTLYGEGTAPLDWVSKAITGRSYPPGIARLDVRKVTAVFPEALAPLAQQIEAQLVLFEVGSAVVASGARTTIDDLAGLLRRLSAETERLGFRIELQLFGRTDTTGTDAVNQSLSQARAEVVRSLLLARNLGTSRFEIVPLGNSQPLSPRAGLDPARANRSVAFHVSLRPLTSEIP